jgi:hypothetical protein
MERERERERERLTEREIWTESEKRERVWVAVKKGSKKNERGLEFDQKLVELTVKESEIGIVVVNDDVKMLLLILKEGRCFFVEVDIQWFEAKCKFKKIFRILWKKDILIIWWILNPLSIAIQGKL